MTIMQWLTGPNGQLFSSCSVIVILVLMLFMAVKLYVSYRSKGTYRLLIAALAAVIARQGLQVLLAFPGWELPAWLHLTSGLLHIVTFIIINFVFMKLYTYRTAQLRIVPFTLMAAAALAIAVAQYAAGPFAPEGIVGGTPAFPMLDVYGIVVVLIILQATRNADMNAKYFAGLIVIFAYDISRMADTYLFGGSQGWLLLLVLLLPIVYFTLLFMLLFEWVIERLMSTYQSSIVDGLTGLYNRRHFNLKAGQLLADGGKTAVIFCDIDNFKRLNDTQGHHSADIVLKRVAEIMKEEAGTVGIAGRYGGEELLACIRTERVKPELVAESIRRRVEAETDVTVSVGFSTSKAAGSIEEMVKQADDAMYYSKTTGKNRVTAYKPSLPTAKM